MSKFTGLIGAKRVSNQAVQSRLYWGFKPYSRLQQAVQDLGVDRPRKLELLALLPCRETHFLPPSDAEGSGWRVCRRACSRRYDLRRSRWALLGLLDLLVISSIKEGILCLSATRDLDSRSSRAVHTA